MNKRCGLTQKSKLNKGKLPNEPQRVKSFRPLDSGQTLHRQPLGMLPSATCLNAELALVFALQLFFLCTFFASFSWRPWQLSQTQLTAKLAERKAQSGAEEEINSRGEKRARQNQTMNSARFRLIVSN